MTVREVLDTIDIAIQDHERSARDHQRAGQRLRTRRQQLQEAAQANADQIRILKLDSTPRGRRHAA
jgi:hypothetical protein